MKFAFTLATAMVVTATASNDLFMSVPWFPQRELISNQYKSWSKSETVLGDSNYQCQMPFPTEGFNNFTFGISEPPIYSWVNGKPGAEGFKYECSGKDFVEITIDDPKYEMMKIKSSKIGNKIITSRISEHTWERCGRSLWHKRDKLHIETGTGRIEEIKKNKWYFYKATPDRNRKLHYYCGYQSESGYGIKETVRPRNSDPVEVAVKWGPGSEISFVFGPEGKNELGNPTPTPEPDEDEIAETNAPEPPSNSSDIPIADTIAPEPPNNSSDTITPEPPNNSSATIAPEPPNNSSDVQITDTIAPEPPNNSSDVQITDTNAPQPTNNSSDANTTAPEPPLVEINTTAREPPLVQINATVSVEATSTPLETTVTAPVQEPIVDGNEDKHVTSPDTKKATTTTTTQDNKDGPNTIVIGAAAGGAVVGILLLAGAAALVVRRNSNHGEGNLGTGASVQWQTSNPVYEDKTTSKENAVYVEM
eukprot:Pgem_evm1s1578